MRRKPAGVQMGKMGVRDMILSEHGTAGSLELGRSPQVLPVYILQSTTVEAL